MNDPMHAGRSQQGWQESEPRVRHQFAVEPTTRIPKIAVILPAYNESGRIGRVLGVLRQVDLVHEIIVVDDGSQDATAADALQAAAIDKRIRLLRHERNQGKGAAMFNGILQTRAGIVLFLDADLIGLTPSQVRNLIQPVASGQADMSIGVFKAGNFMTDLSQRVTPWLSGQRCMRRHLLSQVSTRAAAGYGVETAITIAAQQGKWRVATVPLYGASHPTGEIHRGLLPGVANRLGMYANILQAAWLASGPNFPFSRLTPRIRLLSILMTILFAASLALSQAQALALFQLEDLAAINLEGVFRILVVDQDTASIPDLLTAEPDDQKLLDLPELDLSPLKLPELDLPIIDEISGRVERPELIKGVVLSMDNIQRNHQPNLLKIRMSSNSDPEAGYRLLLVTSSGANQTFLLKRDLAGSSLRGSAVMIELTDYDDPFLIAIALEAELDDQIQRSGWTLILLPELMPRSPLNP